MTPEELDFGDSNPMSASRGMGMSRFTELARLKELEKQATSGKWSWSVDCENYQDGRGSSSADLEIIDNRGCTVCTFIEYAEYEGSIENASLLTDLRNAAPWLLRIAEAFQPGDALLLSRVAMIIGQSAWREEYAKEYEMLRRLQAAAEELER